jgi:hypothetical protein
MSKKVLSLFFVLMLRVGGAAACSDDSGDDGGSTDSGDTGDSGDSGDDSGDGGNADVQAYCDDVDALAAELEDSGGDPAALADLTDELQALQQSGTDLAAGAADLTTEDSEALTECTTALSDAASSLAG